MMTTAAEKVAVPAQKKEEKVEKRRALGRGLESLLPGPRVVAPGGTGGAVQGGGGSGEKQVPHFVRNDKGLLERPPDSGEMEASRAGVSDPHEPTAHAAVPALDPASLDDSELGQYEPGEVISIQAVAAEGGVVGNRVVDLSIRLIEKNPYQTRFVFDEEALGELRDSILE